MPGKLNPKIIAKALATTSGIVYLICAILIAIVPKFTVSIFSYIFHGIDLVKITKTPSINLGTVIGLIEIVIVSYLVGLLFAKIYNYFLK